MSFMKDMWSNYQVAKDLWNHREEVAKGAGEAFRDLEHAQAQASEHPLDTVEALGKSMSDAYERGGGGAKGAILAADVVNPYSKAFKEVHDARTAMRKGDYEEAGRQYTHAVVDTTAGVGASVGAAMAPEAVAGLGAEVLGTAGAAEAEGAAAAGAAEGAEVRGIPPTLRSPVNPAISPGPEPPPVTIEPTPPPEPAPGPVEPQVSNPDPVTPDPHPDDLWPPDSSEVRSKPAPVSNPDEVPTDRPPSHVRSTPGPQSTPAADVPEVPRSGVQPVPPATDPSPPWQGPPVQEEPIEIPVQEPPPPSSGSAPSLRSPDAVPDNSPGFVTESQESTLSGFTPAGDGQATDPNQGGSCQAPAPDSGGSTPADGGQPTDPNQGGSSQVPPADGGNSTPAPQQSADPDPGGLNN